jgi:hypothetical protein
MSYNPYVWREIRKGLMCNGPDWKNVVESLPDRMNAEEAIKLMQSKEQLLLMSGHGYVAGSKLDLTIDAQEAKKFMHPDGFYGVEDFALQWLHRFLILEGIFATFGTKPLPEWPPMFMAMVDEGLHFMTYMAALMCLLEEKRMGAVWSDVGYITDNHIKNSQDQVRKRLMEAVEFLHPKAQDYGESFRRHGIYGLLPRLWDKIARIIQLKADARIANFEKLADSAKDLLGYSTIAWSLVIELPEEERQRYAQKQEVVILRPGEES